MIHAKNKMCSVGLKVEKVHFNMFTVVVQPKQFQKLNSVFYATKTSKQTLFSVLKFRDTIK